MANVVELNHFDELGKLASQHEWLLLDFWAPWCGPCKTLSPVLETFSEQDPDTLVVKVNVDDKRDLAVKFGVRAIPTLVLLNRDQFMGQETGSRSLKDLQDWVNGLKRGEAKTA